MCVTSIYILWDHLRTDADGPSCSDDEKRAKRLRSTSTTPRSVRGTDPDDYDRAMGVTSVGSRETVRGEHILTLPPLLSLWGRSRWNFISSYQPATGYEPKPKPDFSSGFSTSAWSIASGHPCPTCWPPTQERGDIGNQTWTMSRKNQSLLDWAGVQKKWLESVGISNRLLSPCHTRLRRPPRGPFGYQGVSTRGVRHSPGHFGSRLSPWCSRVVLRPVLRHNKQQGVCKTKKTSCFTNYKYILWLRGHVGGAWPPKHLCWSPRRRLGEWLVVSWSKRRPYNGQTCALYCWGRFGPEEGKRLISSSVKFRRRRFCGETRLLARNSLLGAFQLQKQGWLVAPSKLAPLEALPGFLGLSNCLQVLNLPSPVTDWETPRTCAPHSLIDPTNTNDDQDLSCRPGSNDSLFFSPRSDTAGQTCLFSELCSASRVPSPPNPRFCVPLGLYLADGLFSVLLGSEMDVSQGMSWCQPNWNHVFQIFSPLSWCRI